jgi:hypothetical protein
VHRYFALASFGGGPISEIDSLATECASRLATKQGHVLVRKPEGFPFEFGVCHATSGTGEAVDNELTEFPQPG